MAEVSITSAAATVIRALFDELREHEGHPTPFLIIQWFPGATENRRGHDGNVVWEQVEQPEWRASVGGWKEPKARGIAEHALRIGDVNVLLDAKAESADGFFVIDAVDSELTVLRSKRPAGESPSDA